MIYDTIIIGAGLGGISAGLNLAVHDKKVLILEKNSLPGGLASTFKRGRFEFDTSLYELYDIGDEEHIGSIRKMFDKYGLEIETIPVMDNIIHVVDNKETFLVKGKIEDFLLELEKLKEGSIDSLKQFLKVTKEVHEGFLALLEGTYTSEGYPTFDKYLGMNVKDALLDLKIPKDTINRLGFLWIYLGSPLNKLAFIDFADFMYRFIFKKSVVLKNRNLSFILEMINNYEKLGGKIYYRSLVKEIRNKEDIKEVETSDGKVYKAKNIICDVSKRYVYKNLIKEENKEINRLINARTLSPSGFMVYLGLNKDYSTLGLNHYHYYNFQSMNSEICYKAMNGLYHSTWEALVPNVVNSDASPKGTTILILKTSYPSSISLDINNENYEKINSDIASDLIEQFEMSFNLDISEYIEEIEASTPITIERYTNNINGSMMGSMRLGYDNAINRVINYHEEEIPGISFVGGNSLFGGGSHNALYSGYYVTEKLLESEDNDGE